MATTPATFAADTAARKQAANPLTTTADKVTAANNVAAEQLASTVGEKITFQEKVKLDSMFKTGTADLGLLGYNTDILNKPASEATQQEKAGKPAAAAREVVSGSGGRPNPLDDYANYTYGISLHILPPSIYNKLVTVPGYQYIPTTEDGQGTVLIASAGRKGENFKRDANFVEDFYFENLKFTTIIGLNARTRGTNVIEVHFTIMEPYGITLMNRLLAVADTLKAKNWDQLPFMLQIDFYGNSDKGQPLGPISEQIKFIPIKLINCKIKASLRGSEYQFDAVPYAHLAYSESNCTTPAFFEVQAKDIKEFFSFTRGAGQASTIVASNAAASDAVHQAKLNAYDIDPNASGDGKRTAATVQSDSMKSAIDIAKANKEIGYRTYSYTAAMNSYEDQLKENKHQQWADKFKFEIDDDIANSKIVDPKRNPANSTIMKNRKDVETLRSKFNVVPTGIVETESSTFSINAGTSIVEVINQVIKNSDFFKRQIKDPPPTEVKEDNPIFSFKIVPRIELGDFDEKRRVYQKTITYYITKIPYFNTKYPKADNSLPSKCVKAYYYMYTGKNQAILDFSIDFDSMFFTIMTADAAKNQSIAVQEAGSVESKADTTSTDNAKKASIAVNKYKNVSAQTDSANTTNSTRDKTTIAANDLYKSMLSSSRGDMINVKLKISGDPEFIKQDDLFFNPSNMVAQGQDLDIDKHSSLTMDTQQIFALLEFRTPYDINQDAGLMDLDNRYSTSVFSGIYQILQIENSFERGQFTQTLDLIRLFDQPKYDSNIPATAAQQRVADPKTVAAAAAAWANSGEAQQMQNGTDAKTAPAAPSTNKEVGKVEEVENNKANVTDVAPDLNRQSLQKIDETAPTTSITSTAGDGNVVDMGLG